eukprot:TRINITY_DN13277_c0_g1_i1.p1 TRINITY_DN13277_c0_g1~~TRINITY_DN13277_c0_g1_i1.p1  ORF type:complete len:172 (-),score=30.62 TRINITY_DN13277_c0_g1_i1:208-723(-)
MVMKAVPARKTPYTQDEVWQLVDWVELCIELCGARQVCSTNKMHYVADGLLGAGVVRGPKLSPELLNPASMSRVNVSLLIGGVQIATGSGKNNPCDSPVASLTYLVNDLCVRRGIPIEPAQLVICGHCCAAAFEGRPKPPFMKLPCGGWKDGDFVRAEFEGIGSVQAALFQ